MKNIFLVDADDTLLDFHASSALALQSAFESFGLPWSEERLTSFRRINDGLWQALERKEITRDELIKTRFSIYLREIGADGIDGDRFNEGYMHALATRPLYIDGAECFLQELCKLGTVYIVTNGTEWIQSSRFTLCGLWAYAKEAFISQAVGADKPSPVYTRYVTEHIDGFDRANAVWIGDSLSADIRAANEANICSVWFNPRGKKREGTILPTAEARSYSEILTFLKKSDF